jgi:hypothetical protein
MIYDPREYLPYMTRIADPRFHGFEIGVMVHYPDTIGVTRGSFHIMEFYKGRPVLLRMPLKRFKYSRN